LETKGPIHNPHYFEYIRNRPNNGGENEEADNENQCGMPSNNSLVELDNRLFHVSQPYTPVTGRDSLRLNVIGQAAADANWRKTFYSVLKIVEQHNHIQQMVIPFLVPPTNEANMNRDLRISFILGEITEEYFKLTIQQREKKTNKDRDNLLVYEMFVQSCLDIVRRVFKEGTTKEKYVEITNEYFELVEYANTCFKKVGKIYKCVAKKVVVEP
jgi:hypothetical protein